MTTKEPTGHLNLVSVFESEASRLLNAAREGQILHRTKNIRDSGAPLESALLDLFNRRLPRSYEASSGYFYSEESKCSPQVDFLVCEQGEIHGLGPGEHGRLYKPFPSVRVVGEIKNSSYSMSDTLAQFSDYIESWRAMRAESLQILPGIRRLVEQPLGFVLIARSPTLKVENIREIYKKEGNKPDYLVLLDRGIVVASSNPIFGGKDGTLSFSERRLAGEWFIHKPSQSSFACGRTLLWLYFAIAAALHLSEGNVSSHVPFTWSAEKAHRLVAQVSLASATGW